MYSDQRMYRKAYEQLRDHIQHDCTPETQARMKDEIRRASRLELMNQALNCVEGGRDCSDDDLLVPITSRRDELLFRLGMSNLETAISGLEEDRIYLGLPWMTYCHKQLLPLFIINRKRKPIVFLARRAVAVVSDEVNASYAGERNEPAPAIEAKSEVHIAPDTMEAIDDYDIYVDGDLMEWWNGTLVVEGAKSTYWCNARALTENPHIVELELKFQDKG